MKKTIIISVSVSLILLLLGAIIFLSFYKKDFSYDFETPTLVEVNDQAAFDKDTLKADEIMKLLTENSKESVLKYMFNKNDISEPSITKRQGGNVKVPTDLQTKSSYPANSFVVRLTYDDEEGKVLKLNGETYKDPKNSTIEQVNYKELRFLINENCKDTRIQIYVMDMKQKDYSGYVIEQYGDYTKLYEYLQNGAGNKVN